MREVSPVGRLLDQWLLLPLFLHVGLLLLLVRSARGRVATLLAVLIGTFSIHNLTYLWPSAPTASLALSIAEAPLVALFTLGYTSGKHLSGRGIIRGPLFFIPALLVLVVGVSYGWSPPHPAYLLHGAVFYLLASLFLYVRRSEAVLSGREPQMIASALTVLFVAGPVCDALLPFLGVSIAIFPYASAGASVILTLLVLRYKAFSPAPATEGSGNGEGWTGPGPGVYLASEGGNALPRDVFLSAARAGVPGLVISHTHPVSLRATTGLRKVPVIWMAQSVYERALSPSECDVLFHTVRDYIEQSKRSVVLIENLDYIITNAGYFSTLDLVRDLIPAARKARATIVLSSNLLTPEERREILQLGVLPLG
ncbi:MAG: DUF835 domain-containing protein [Thermoplasmata archaeon]